jgi:hypothetical protein
MKTDDRFPTKLPSVLNTPEPFRSALADSISSQESIRFLIQAPAFATPGERTSATVLAVTDKGWLIVSETEDGGATSKSRISATRSFLNSRRFFFGAN